MGESGDQNQGRIVSSSENPERGRENRAPLPLEDMEHYVRGCAFRMGEALPKRFPDHETPPIRTASRTSPVREVRDGLLALVSKRLIQDSRARKAIAGFIAGLALSYGVEKYRGSEEIAYAAGSQEAVRLEQFRQSNPELNFLLSKVDLGDKKTEEGVTSALWGRFLSAENEKRYSFFKGEWKGLDPDAKARIMLRFVESDLDKTRPFYVFVPFTLLEHYLSHPLAKEILLKAVAKEPAGAFRNFKQYREKPWAMQILEEAVKHATALEGRCSLRELVRDDALSEDEHMRLEGVIAQEHPDPSVDELWQKFSEEPGEMKTDFFDTIWQGLGVQAKGDFMKKLLDSRWKFAARQAFLRFPEYKLHPDANIIVYQAMGKEPGRAIENFDVYRDQPFAEGVIERAIRKDRGSAIKYFKKYSHFPWAEQALKEMVSIEPYYAIERFTIYDAFPWAESVLKTALDGALKEGPWLVIKRHATYKDFPWAQQLLREAIAKDADAAMEYFATYKEYPWADESFLVEQAKRASYKSVRGFLQSNVGKSLPEAERSHIEAAVPELAKVADTLLERDKEPSSPRFREDPAVQHIGEIDPSWVPDKHVNKADKPALAQYRTLIARNLYFQGIETITKEAVQKESERIILMRERYQNVPLFKGRNIIVAAHLELTPEDFRNPADPWRFGKDALISELKRQQSAGGQEDHSFSVQRERPKIESMEEVSRVKRETLNLIKMLPGPLTFIFDGHGGPDGLYFSAGLPDAGGGVPQTQEWRRISPQELADALVARYVASLELHNENPGNGVILVLDDCYSSTYLRKLYSILTEHNVPKPIVIGASEYGQLGYSDFHSPYGSSFMGNTILQKDTGGDATIGGVVDHDETQKDSNPSLYIPDEANRPMQLSKEQEAKEDEALAA